MAGFGRKSGFEYLTASKAMARHMMTIHSERLFDVSTACGARADPADVDS